MPKKSKLTQKVKEDFVRAISSGAPRKYAAGYAGVSESDVKYWMHRGQEQEADEPFSSFAADVLKAEHRVVVTAFGVLRSAGAKDWKAALTIIKLKAPELFAEETHKGLRKHVQLVFDVIEDLLGRDSARRVGEEVARRVGVADSTRSAAGAGRDGAGLH